jgi:hypothetical protein
LSRSSILLNQTMNSDRSTTTATTYSGLGNSSRIYTPPLMGTSARAVRRRVDNDAGPIRIDGTDIYNQQLQHDYQNVRQILEDQQPNQLTNVDQSDESRQSFSAKRDFFEQRFKTPPSTYDSPPREQLPPTQKIITTITTTTRTSPTLVNRRSASLNNSPVSIDRLLEQAPELQKITHLNSLRTDSPQPFVIERKEQYQLVLDPTKQEILRASTNPTAKTSRVTDLDQAQVQVNRFSDDHHAIQQLTRALQDHNITTTNEYKRLPSQTSPILINTTTTTTTTYPSNIILADQPITSEFSVIDALLDNPLGTNNTQQNRLMHRRFTDIRSNLRNPDYVTFLKQSIIKKKTKKKKSKKKQIPKPVSGPLVDKETQLTESMIDPNWISAEETPLLSLKEIKKQEQKKLKTKSKQLSKNTNYHVIDAILNSPISIRLPDSYLAKLKIRRPPSQLSSTSPITSRYTNIPLPQQSYTKAKNETVYGLAKVVNELMLHHAAAVTASNQTNTKGPQQSMRPTNLNTVIQQQYPLMNNNQYETHLSSEPIKPRIIYRYLDEQGNVLKLSPTPPSQLHEIIPEQTRQNFYHNTEPTYLHSRKIAIDDEQRATWHKESKLPKTIKREDFELQDRRIPQLSEQPVLTTRAIPVSIEREHSKNTPSYQPSNQEHVKLTWLPLSHQYEQQDNLVGPTGYDTDSTNSDNSTTYRHYDYAPIDPNYRRSNRPLLQNRSPGRSCHASPPPPPHSSYINRGISPEYGGNNVSRNYIEVFRDGETKPSQVYSLPFNEPISTNHRHSRYDQYQAENDRKKHFLSSSPNSRYERIIPISPTSHHDPSHHHTVHSSPTRDYIYFDNYLRQSKSSDYRPLRTKLQREYKITPSLLVDEWDHHPPQPTDNNKKTIDEVFISNYQTNKA